MYWFKNECFVHFYVYVKFLKLPACPNCHSRLITVGQCLSQDLETGCLKLAVVKFLGVQILRGITIYSYFNHKPVFINISKIRHNIIKQCHGNYQELKKFNYKLEKEIFRDSKQKYLGVLRGPF